MRIIDMNIDARVQRITSKKECMIATHSKNKRFERKKRKKGEGSLSAKDER